MSDTRAIRIGSGAGFAGDRITPAVELSTDPALDYLGFECLAERTIALAQREKLDDPEAGYNPRLEERFEAVLENCVANDITIVTNMGAANPQAAAAVTTDIARELGVDELNVAATVGSDVFDQLDAFDRETFSGEPLASYRDRAVSANAYLGVDPIVEALDADADVVITDRVSDVSLYLAPMVHEFGWELPTEGTSDVVGQGTVAAHLIECAGQLTGGYFADPGRADVPDLANLGFPIAEVSANGDIVVTKSPKTGGAVTTETCTQQLLYEVQDPSAYVTPDGVADFSEVTFTELERDRVRVEGAVSSPPPERLKVNVGYVDGYTGVGEISYAGPNADGRARLAGEIVSERVDLRDLPVEDLRIDHVGIDSLHGDVAVDHDPYEVRLRVAARCPDETTAEAVAREVQTLYTNGPAGGGGARMQTKRVVGVVSTLVDRTVVNPTVELAEVTP